MERNIPFSWKSIVDEAIRRRKTQRLTQSELARLAGVSKPTLNQFEQGHTTLTLKSVFKILHILGITSSE